MLGENGRQLMSALLKQLLPGHRSPGTFLSALSSTLLMPSKRDAGVLILLMSLCRATQLGNNCSYQRCNMHAYVHDCSCKAHSADNMGWHLTYILTVSNKWLVTYRDLLEVCEAELQFGTKAELPVFGGSRGPDISKSMTDIQVCMPC